MKRFFLVMCATLAVAGLIGAGVAMSDDETAPPPPAPRGETLAPVQHVESKISDNLGLFRAEGARAYANIAPGTREAFGHIGQYAGANLSLARTAQTPDGPVHIIPGDGHVCFIGPGGMACGTSAYLSEHPQSYTTIGGSIEYPRGTVRVSGIAPDEVTGIEAVGPDDQRTTVTVVDNAYSGFIPVKAERLDFHTTDRGTISAPMPDLPDASK